MLKIWWREIGKLRTESAPSSIARAEAWLWCPLAHKTYNTCTTGIDKVFSIGLTAWSPTCAVSVGYWDCFLIRLAFIHVIFGYSLHHLNYGYETLSVQLLPSDSYRHARVARDFLVWQTAMPTETSPFNYAKVSSESISRQKLVTDRHSAR